MPHGAPAVQHRDILRYEEIARIVRIAASLGITKVRITGGEPLVRKDCVQLIKMIREIPEIDTIAMTTNGILLSEYLSELVRAGLNAVNISLDTLLRAGGDNHKNKHGFAGGKSGGMGRNCRVGTGIPHLCPIY